MKFIKILSTLLLLTLASSCIYIPHSVKLDPKIESGKSSIGNRNSVNISVEDKRDDKNLIGRRGNGIASVAPITNDQNLEQMLSDIVIKSLKEKQFSVPRDGGKKLEIYLLSLKYESLFGFFTLGTKVDSVIEVKVLNYDNSVQYKKIYRSNLEKRHFIVPTSGTNEKNINISFENVINSMLKDQKLISALSN